MTALAAIDLSAAFDTVDHLVLSKVLSTNFGVSGHCIKWFDNYLSPRNSKLNINNDYSSAKNLEFSVPQGSVAGPTLYSVYASSMKKCVSDNVDLHGYADDHALKRVFWATIEIVNLIQSMFWKTHSNRSRPGWMKIDLR